MSEAYGEPVNVRARPDGRPTRFVWRGRLYAVRVILEHWVINREWWQDPDAERGQPVGSWLHSHRPRIRLIGQGQPMRASTLEGCLTIP